MKISRTIIVSNNTACIDTPIYLYKGDGNILISLDIINITISTKLNQMSTTSYIDDNVSYATACLCKRDNFSTLHIVGTKVNDKIEFELKKDMMDEIIEVGEYRMQVHLFDKENNRLTIPVVEEINIMLPLCSDGYAPPIAYSSKIGEAIVDYSMVVAESIAVSSDFYNTYNWTTGEYITANKLNNMITGIDEALYDIRNIQNNYVTKSELSNKANRNEIPTKTSQLLNDEGYLTEHQDLSDYATKSYVDSEIANAKLESGEVDLKGYATKDELNAKANVEDVPTKISDLQNDMNFISSIPSEYVTETELNNKGYLTEHQSLDDYATKSYVDSEIANAQLSGETNPFYGKIANFLGDSQTEANYHKTKIYHEWVKEILGLVSVNNYGISGTTITKKTSSDTSAMCVRYNNMSNSADLICVMGGVNDVWFNSPLGIMGDTDASTFYGAMDTLCKGLYTKYPGKTIIFITPTEQNNVNCTNANTIGTCVGDYARAMRMVCAKYGIKVFDAHATLGIYPYITSNSDYYTTDGLHLNDVANEKLGKELAKFILYGSQLLVYVNDETETEPEPEPEPEVKSFIGKTVSFNPTTEDCVPVHFTLVCESSELKANETLSFNMGVSNVSGVPFKNSSISGTGIGGIFYTNSDKAGDGAFTTVAQTPLEPTFTNNTVSHSFVLNSTYSSSNGSHVKIGYALMDVPKGSTCTFTIESLSLTCGGRDVNILDVGAFFPKEGCSVN